MFWAYIHWSPQVSKITWQVMSLKSWIKTGSSLEEIITSINELFNDFESDIAVRIGNPGNATRETVKSNVITK